MYFLHTYGACSERSYGQLLGTLPAEDPPPNPPLPMTTFIAVQPTGIKKQRTLLDVRLKTVAKGASIVVSHPAVVQQQEQRRQAQRDRELSYGLVSLLQSPIINRQLVKLNSFGSAKYVSPPKRLVTTVCKDRYCLLEQPKWV